MLNQVSFSTFDILTDDEVRQGLKTYSNWPTYPQVYVKVSLHFFTSEGRTRNCSVQRWIIFRYFFRVSWLEGLTL